MMIIHGRSLVLWARVGARGMDELLSHGSATVTNDLFCAFRFLGEEGLGLG